MEEKNIEKVLIEKAILARENSYSPYSNFKVGACLITEDGEFYSGCNIENAAYGPTNCAERTAIFKAVSEGKRKFSKIAVIGDEKNYCYPCGVCRQVISEFCDKDFEIICAKNVEEYEVYKLSELLPKTFDL